MLCDSNLCTDFSIRVRCDFSITDFITYRICDALLKANKQVMFKGKDKEFSISDTIYDMQAYQQLNDSVSKRFVLKYSLFVFKSTNLR